MPTTSLAAARSSDEFHRVVIVGGGFGGLYAARRLGAAPLEVLLIDRRNFHLFQPLLYQVATGQLSPANIAAPLRGVLKRQKNTRVIMAEVVGFDLACRRVLLRGNDQVDYDSLIVATGSTHHYFGKHHWAALAPGLKSVEDATEIRGRILRAFEAAERESSPEEIRGWLTFVIVGGGPTGVEMSGAIAELSRHTLRHNFRRIDPAIARIVLTEGADRVLPTYPQKLSQKAADALTRLGVTIRTGSVVTDIQPDRVTIVRGIEREKLPARTVIWAAGVQASSLGRLLAQAAGAATDAKGRVLVQPDLTIAGHPEIFVIGDLANFSHQGGSPLPGIAPVAIQQGLYVAKRIERRLQGKSDTAPFHYKDRGNLATIGRAAAVADLGWARFSGFAAWLFWLLVHILNLIQFENRLLVMTQWAWNYFTRNRSARLITGEGSDDHSDGGQR